MLRLTRRGLETDLRHALGHRASPRPYWGPMLTLNALEDAAVPAAGQGQFPGHRVLPDEPLVEEATEIVNYFDTERSPARREVQESLDPYTQSGIQRFLRVRQAFGRRRG